jgi:hypothetical protein
MFDEAWAQAAREAYMGNFKCEHGMSARFGCILCDIEDAVNHEPDPLTAPRPMTSEERKQYPLTTGVIDYFPDALLYVAHVSYVANEQHNPGEKMHWAKENSIGYGDQIGRHLIGRDKVDDDNLLHAGKLAWRSLEYLQRLIEKKRSERANGIQR